MKSIALISAAASTLLLVGASALTSAFQVAGKKPDPHAIEFFEKKIRPLLFSQCFGCHGPSKQMGGLRLDSIAAILKGNSGGPAIIPGNTDNSVLIQVVRQSGKVKMPPTGKLKAHEIQALEEWVRMGAPWPENSQAAQSSGAIQSGEYQIPASLRNHWSFKPVIRPRVPRPKDPSWKVRNPLDAFWLAGLEKRGLKPGPPADKRALIRRAYIDLTGLPPTAEEADAFVGDSDPAAFSRLVDKLLESPRYGERWGRYWLDIARYADTKGYVFTEDRNYPNAYTYRDYVIRAFNEDLPYDRFILEQIAADRLPLGDDRRPLAAMGFLTVGRRFLNNQPDIIDDRIDVTMRGFQGLTVACARCHDHKYDPIPTADYYSLYGVFASSMESNPPPGISPRSISEPYDQHTRKILDAEKEEKNILQSQIRRLRQLAKDAPDSLSKEVKDILQGFRVGALPEPPKLRKLEELAFEQEARDRLKPLRDTITQLKASMPTSPEFAMAMEDRETPVNPKVFIRGNPNNQGKEVSRQFLQIVAGGDRSPFKEGSGRLELARAIADPRNPLTARVMVNRIWMHHFGFGIVRTPSDFGTRCEPPTHPDLLDWLASEFVNPSSLAVSSHRNGKAQNLRPWSIKYMHRLIMNSAVYQQSSVSDAARFTVDPENRLVSRMNRRRLDLEAMRDSMLAVSGRLDLTAGGKSVDILSPKSVRRTVFGFIERQNLPGFFRTFDFASPDLSTPTRSKTTVPQQALFMMNSPFVVEQARALAARPELAGASDNAARIRALYRLVLGRNPSGQEIRTGARFLESTPTVDASLQLVSSTVQKSTLIRLEQLAQVLLMSNEFMFVD